MPRTPSKALSFALLLGTAACASGRAAPAPAAPAPLPAQPVQAPEPIRENFQLAGAPGTARGNLLGNVRYDLPVEANRWVEMELDFLVNQRRAVIGQWLSRADKYRDFVQEIFASYGIPRDLHHLAMVESGYSPTARSHAGAVGMWQFMSTTGRGMGLRIDDVVDERMDPVRSTHAAARHLRDLHRGFRGDWALAAAAYNAGAGRINRGLGRFNATNFWELAERGDLAQETRHYVPRLYAVTIIGRDPARFGYPAPANVLPRFRPDSVRVDVETPVAELARIANLNPSELTGLNPHLIRGTAPAGYKVWTPAGSGPGIQTAFDSSAYRRSGGYAWYTLRRGENVAQLAAAGGIPVERIREMNLSAALERMGSGDRVRLPAPLVRTLNARPAERPRLASASDEPRGPSSPELDAARAEARRLRAARREEERAREAQREQEREAARIAERARAARRAEEREAARAEERAAAARRLAARSEDGKDDVDTARRRGSDSAETKAAAADEARPTRRSTDSAAARRTSERVASRSASSDDERPSPSHPRRTEREDSSRTRRASDDERPRTHTVERGETLRGLAEKYGVTVAQLREANDIPAGKGVELGMRLRLPRVASSSAPLAAASERAARTRGSDGEGPSTTSRSSTSARTSTPERRTTRSDSSTRRASDEAPRSRTGLERRASSDDETPRARPTTERRDSAATRRTASATRDTASKTRTTSARRDSSATRRTASVPRDSSASKTRSASRDSSAARSRSVSARDSSGSRSLAGRGGRDSTASRTRASSASRDSASTRSRTASGETKPRATASERAEGSTRPRVSASEAPRPAQHTVKSGETLFGIARQHGVTVPALRAANDMGEDATLQPGRKLRIPRS